MLIDPKSTKTNYSNIAIFLPTPPTIVTSLAQRPSGVLSLDGGMRAIKLFWV